MSEPFEITPEQDADSASIETLLDEAFGLTRRTKTSYRLREGVPPIRKLGFTARSNGQLVGTIRFWPVQIAHKWRALLLGPLAVSESFRNNGCGVALMKHGLAQAKALGHTRVFLVGDEPYYKRAGFVQRPDIALTLPGPYEPERLLFYELAPNAWHGVSGLVGRALEGDLSSFAVPGHAEQAENDG